MSDYSPTWFTGSELDSYTTEQLGMCEKSDLVNYILSLKDNILERQDCLTDLEEEVERLQSWEENNLIHKDSVKPIKPVTRSDTRIKQLEEQVEKLTWEISVYDHSIVKGLKNHIKKLKKWSLSEDMIETTSAETIEEFESDVRDNWRELEQLKEQQAPAPELWIRGTIESNSKLYKENKELKEENEKLKIDYSMNKQYWNCYLSYADPKGYGIPEKEHIDNWCKNGDTVDEKLKEYLYDGFCIDEDEDE